jgi:hypothetical protein
LGVPSYSWLGLKSPGHFCIFEKNSGCPSYD